MYIIVYLKKLCTSNWLLSLKIYLCLLTLNCTQNHVSINTYTNSYLMFCDSFQSLVARKTFQFHWNNFPEAFSRGRWESKYTSYIDNLWQPLRSLFLYPFSKAEEAQAKKKSYKNIWQLLYFSFTLLHQ